MIRLMLYAATIQMTYVNSSCLKYVLLSSLTACVQIFLSQASDEIQSLLGLHTSALNEYHAMITYFGEIQTVLTLEKYSPFLLLLLRNLR